MTSRLKTRYLSLLMTALAWSGASLADDIRPDPDTRSDVRPFADEKCIEKCDAESDQCMQNSNGDRDKLQACDEKYSSCLQACEKP